MEPGLAAFKFPNGAYGFMERSWPHVPAVVHELDASVEALTSLPFLQSLDVLLKAWPGSVQAHLPDISDEASSISVTAQDAAKLFSNRMGLLFNNVENISPTLKIWIAALHADLGLPAMTYGRCLVYATPEGKGTAPHFDQNINFVLQLQGTKKWRLAPNENVQNPTQRHTMGQNTDPELASYTETPMAIAMSVDALDVTLKPGSMLFVPRGFWHSTEAEGEALALNFTFSQPTWVDIFTAALRSRLSLSPDWRALADGVSSADPRRREAAQRNFDALLLELTDDLPNWHAEEILGATERDRPQ